MPTSRRDLLALAAGLPLIGRFFRRREPTFESFEELVGKLEFDPPPTFDGVPVTEAWPMETDIERQTFIADRFVSAGE